MLITRLNAAALTDTHSLIVSLSSDAVPSFRTLIDSGSTDSFLDTEFANSLHLFKNRLKQPLRLTLFDGSSAGYIREFVTIPIRFPSGKRMSIDFLLTKLDPSCHAVLGHRWLARYNPSIDWSRGIISFPSPTRDPRNSDSGLQPGPDPESPVSSSDPDPALRAAAAKIPICFIGAAPFRTACRMKGAFSSAILIKDPEAESFARSASYNPASETGENIPSKYHDFLD